GTGSGAYVLDLHAAGDVNGDGVVDGLDTAALAAALGSTGGGRADVNGDGKVDAADSHLVFANLGFSPDLPPQIGIGSGFTHVELETVVPVSSFVTDPEGDPLTFRILSTSGGTARLSGDGSSVVFMPAPGFAGDAGFTFVADDGYSSSAPA